MLDYRPDLDPRTPGLVTAVTDMVPTAKGYTTAPASVNYLAHTLAPIADETIPNKLFATRWLSTPGGIVIVGTNKRLLVFNYATGFINVSKAGNYTLAGQSFLYGEDVVAAFDMCAFGDVLIACNRATATQSRSALDLTSGTLFADLSANAPAAATCCVASNFVFLGNVGNWSTGPVVTGTNNMLVWSAIGDHTGWVNNPTVTQCSSAVFTDTPGPITVVRPLRDGVVVFKAEAMYYGRYVGAGTNSPIWDFVRVSDKIGCAGHRSITDIDNALVFVGNNDIYSFDGTRPTPITGGIIETIRPFLSSSGNVAMRVGHNKPQASCWFIGVSNIFVWNYKYNKWGKVSTTIPEVELPCQTNADDFRVKTLSSVTGSGDQVWTTSSDHTGLYTLTMLRTVAKNRNSTLSTAFSLTTGVFGKPNELQNVSRVNMIFSVRPVLASSGSVTLSGGTTISTLGTLGTVTLDSSYRANLLGISSTQNWFKTTYNGTEDCEIIDIVPTIKPAGAR